MAQINLEAVDTDGAIQEAAEAVAGDTRMSLPAQGRRAAVPRPSAAAPSSVL